MLIKTSYFEPLRDVESDLKFVQFFFIHPVDDLEENLSRQKYPGSELMRLSLSSTFVSNMQPESFKKTKPLSKNFR